MMKATPPRGRWGGEVGSSKKHTVKHVGYASAGVVIIDEQLLVLGVVVGAEVDDIAVANPADELHLLLEVAAASADLLEPLDDDGGGVLEHRAVRRPERALAEHLGGGAEQVLQVERQRRALEEHHAVAVPGLADDGLGLGRLPALLLPARVVVAGLPVAERDEEPRDGGEHEDAAGDGEDGRLAEPHVLLRGRGRTGGQRGRQDHRRRGPRHVVPGERGVGEPEQGSGHGAVEMVVGEVEELERREAEVGDVAGERVVGEVERDEVREVGERRAREAAAEGVEGEVEHLEAPQAREPGGERAGEGVALEVEAREVGEAEQVVGERAGEVVGAEAEDLQSGEAAQRARRHGAGEAQPREVELDDARAVGAAGDPRPHAAGALRRPGPVDARAAHGGEEVEQRRLVGVRLGRGEEAAGGGGEQEERRWPRHGGGAGGGQCDAWI
jgi:hypothetical protein